MQPTPAVIGLLSMVKKGPIQRRPGRKTKTAIFSAKKKTTRLARRRYIVLSAVLLIVLACALLLVIHLTSRGTGGTAPVPPESPAVGPPPASDEAAVRIAALNEKITGELSDMGLAGDRLAKRTEEARRANEIDYTEVEEAYSVPEGMRTERVREYLKKYITGFKGVLREETTETEGGGFDMTVFAYGVPIRRLSFSGPKGAAPPPITPPAKLPKVTIIIDDMGGNKGILSDLLSLKYPVTLSVIPFQEYSKETAEIAHKKGREVMLHLPMEPLDYPQYNPGTGALFTFMTNDEFRAALSQDLAAVPYISGVNNHMGSSLTQDREKMEIVLLAVKERRLFFVDSRTTPKSVAYDVAVKLGVAALERNVFLDNDANVTSIKQKIDELITKAKSGGRALAIGHPRPETIKALKEMEKRLTGTEVRVVPVRDLLKK
jgi:polysaccharide deacetylase 2 family uncharacterized protein YibQ